MCKLNHLRFVLRLVLVAYGLQREASKSEIVPVGDVGDVEGLASILGCGVTSLLMKYMGLSLVAHYKAYHLEWHY